MLSYLSWKFYGSPNQQSPVQELGQAIQGTFGAALTSSKECNQDSSKISELRRTLSKIIKAEGLSPRGFREQVEMAKALNREEHIQNEQSLVSLSGHSYEIMKSMGNVKFLSENSSFDQSLEFVRNNFDLIVQAQTLSTENVQAYNEDLEILSKNISQDVANSVNDFVQLNLKEIKKETLDPDYYKTVEDLEKEFVLIS